jgi:hypothetical protein
VTPVTCFESLFADSILSESAGRSSQHSDRFTIKGFGDELHMTAPQALDLSAPRSVRPAPGETSRHAALGLIGPAQWLVAAAIGVGWWIREDRWLVPEEGAGYLLGPIGLGMMVLLLAYPLRKRVSLLRGWGRISRWFEIHMLLGLMGPLAILYHANFRLGSLNANVALACMLAVAGSGVIGRVVYVRIHEGLSGRRRTLAELRDAIAETRSSLALGSSGEAVVAALSAFEQTVLGQDGTARPGALGLIALPWRWRRARRRAYRILARQRGKAARQDIRHAKRAVSGYLRTLRGVARFSFYERFFALWHVAHLPLSFLLFASAAIHVAAVHMY